jgi:hypothetical protein
MIVSLALGIVSSVWPELIRPHPHWVAALVVNRCCDDGGTAV